MLYKKNSTEKLDEGLFKNPASEYRGTPFWAWNCELDQDMLMRQIEYLKKMGFGGFHMHSRSGMATKYLSEDFMKLVKACRDKAEREHMLAWLYDEDRWSSGSAGGYVTKTKKHRQKKLVISETPVAFADRETGHENALPYLVGVYDIILDGDGRLVSSRMIGENDKADGVKRYAYVATNPESGWYNNQTYSDTLSEEAVDEFIKITYESYKKSVGESFGGSVPAIFTDEPNYGGLGCLPFGLSSDDVTLPWTYDFAETFEKTYGFDIVPRIPEIVWDLAGGGYSQARYFYHDHICERFCSSFCDRCGSWCNENNIYLTGHVLLEETLSSQNRAVGEAMRAYRSFGIPGIDILTNNVELNTAKQAQSVVHQMGREAMLSELYGVTNWDFDFRGHKFQGDWQAALGVTVRVPHLSWVSMKGSAKRDYPASINYQSPWFEDYSYIENHFARLNTVLTRGKPVVNVAVIHPIESYWINYGPADSGSDIRTQLDENFANLTTWLLSDMIDFDFISESLLPRLAGDVSDTLTVGEMKYSAVIVPGCITLRKTTLDILKKFTGKLIFVGNCPEFVDALPSGDVMNLYEKSLHAEFSKTEITSLLKSEQTAKIVNERGITQTQFVHTLRRDGDVLWFFLARYVFKNEPDAIAKTELTITMNGEYVPELYDTLTGEVKRVDFVSGGGKTVIKTNVYTHDSVLLRLAKGAGSHLESESGAKRTGVIDFRDGVSYRREEDNVYLLDMAEYSLDGGDYETLTEILTADVLCRRKLGFPMADGEDTQPWAIEKKEPEHFVTLRFKINSKAEINNAFIAGEEAVSITVNGESADLTPCGYYVDESIKKYKCPKIRQGENVIEISAPITERLSLESYYLLGDFDVYVRGCKKEITAPSRRIGFGDLSVQGLPFYGGNVVYSAKIKVPDCSLKIRTSRYRGAAVKVYIDGKFAGMSAFEPYTVTANGVKAGEHTVEFKLLGSRVNTFGAVHSCDYSTWYGPSKWYTHKIQDDGMYSESWSPEYVLRQTGILSSPVIEIISEKEK